MITLIENNMYYIAAVALIVIGLYMVLVKSNLIKIMLGIGLMDTGTNVLLIALGYVRGGTAPIFSPALLSEEAGHVPTMVDPIPQALVLTAIVIGVGVLALGLTLVVRVYRHYGTLNADKIRGLRW